MSNNEFSNDFEIQDAEASSVGMNNFVFHNNQEFINFQRCFVDGYDPDYEPVFQQNTDTELVFHPSNECDHITLTFMYNGGQPYQIINNRAFYLKGFKKIVIQGARSRKSQRCNIPVLEVVNECAEGVPTYLDSNGNACHSYNHDDAIFNIQNPHSNPVDVVVSDIEFRVAFKLQDVESAQMHEHWYDPTICPVLFKVYEASSFKMFNVKMYSQYLNFTHVFIHWCENVDIRNCVFKNYNAHKIGGNLWLCQRVKNVTIVNNDFYKYGNDENIAIWGDSIMSRDELHCYNSENTLVGLDDEKYANRHLEFEHIHIKNNRFYYEKPAVSPYTGESFPEFINLDGIHQAQINHPKFYPDNETQWDGVIDIFQSLYISQHTPFAKFDFIPVNDTDTNLPGTGFLEQTMQSFTVAPTIPSNGVLDSTTDYAIVPYVHVLFSDVVVSGNEYYINSPMRTLMGYTFDNFCRTEGIQITNNLIKHGSWAQNQCQLQDFKIVYDKNPDREAGTDLEGTNKMCLDPIRIEGNTVESKAFPFMVYFDNEKQEFYASETHIVLNVENASAQFNGNTINEDSRCVQNVIDQNPDKIVDLNSQIISDVQNHGYYLLYSRDKGGIISMNDNVLRGIANLGNFCFEAGNSFSRIELTVSNNVFYGKTSCYNLYVKEGFFKFFNNVFFAENFILLMQEMPIQTTLILKENVFKRVSNNEENAPFTNLYYCEQNSQDESFIFPLPDYLTIISSGNIFDNIWGNICPDYPIENVQICSSNEHPIDQNFGTNE